MIPDRCYSTVTLSENRVRGDMNEIMTWFMLAATRKGANIFNALKAAYNSFLAGVKKWNDFVNQPSFSSLNNPYVF